MTCEHKYYKKIITHGNKSRGYYICKECDSVVKRCEMKNRRINRGGRKQKGDRFKKK